MISLYFGYNPRCFGAWRSNGQRLANGYTGAATLFRLVHAALAVAAVKARFERLRRAAVARKQMGKALAVCWCSAAVRQTKQRVRRALSIWRASGAQRVATAGFLRRLVGAAVARLALKRLARGWSMLRGGTRAARDRGALLRLVERRAAAKEAQGLRRALSAWVTKTAYRRAVASGVRRAVRRFGRRSTQDGEAAVAKRALPLHAPKATTAQRAMSIFSSSYVALFYFSRFSSFSFFLSFFLSFSSSSSSSVLFFSTRDGLGALPLAQLHCCEGGPGEGGRGHCPDGGRGGRRGRRAPLRPLAAAGEEPLCRLSSH